MLQKTRVLIADNHPISRAGLRLVLESTAEFSIVGEAMTGLQAVNLCKQLLPDLVLMDVNMPNGNGLEATEVIHRELPKIRVIAISGYDHEEVQREIYRAGAIGFIPKSTDFQDMLSIIRSLVAGAHTQLGSQESLFDLTKTEFKILALLAEGHDRQQIADNLQVSINTVKMHLRNLYQKLNVSSSDQAIKVAIRYQLLS